MKNEDGFDILRNLNKKEENKETTVYDSYKNIDLNKILKEQIYPDEKIVYVAKTHWILLFWSIFLFIIVLIGVSVTKSFLVILAQPILLIMIIFSILGIISYFNAKFILTNVRYIPTSLLVDFLYEFLLFINVPIKNKGYLLSRIKSVSSYKDFFGNGTLYLDNKNPKKILAPSHCVKNVRALEFKITEQLKLSNKNNFVENEDFISFKKQLKHKYILVILLLIIMQIVFLIFDFKVLNAISLFLLSLYLAFKKFRKS
ncbi:MAG: hypothetical protein WCK67_13425 [bacterium]